LLPGGTSTQNDRVQLKAYVIGVDPAVFDQLNLDISQSFTVEASEPEGLGAASTRSATKLVSANVVGGAMDSQVLVPQGASVGSFLPAAVPLVNSAKESIAQQVMVSVRIAEVSLNGVEEFGVDITGLGDLSSSAPLLPTLTPEVFSLQGGILDDDGLNTLLQALREDSTAEILESPQIVTLNNQTAAIIAENESGSANDLDQPFADVAIANPQINFVNGGILLDVTPTISDDGRTVNLNIRPGGRAITAFVGQPFDDPTGQGFSVQLPIVQQAAVSTTVSVPDGGTLLLGGIRVTEESEVERGVPILNKVPYINRLFRNTATIKDTQTLMLLVTPRIIIQEEEE
jgi:type II secretory pathway component GspD/PulD (secretin)